MNLDSIKRISPLYDYWLSDQNQADDKKRKLKVNKASPARYLFEKEPYKWENLYQSIMHEIINGDNNSLKGLKVLLNTINQEEQDRMIQSFLDFKLLNKEQLDILLQIDINSQPTKKNLFRFLRILYSIFANPYRIDIKGKKNHLYEKTGSLINDFRRLFD